ncbi:MAG: signal peptidase I [Oscillospiraceae bacterium]|nr:signal peptidase I [Oscillospiraceae bacterium]
MEPRIPGMARVPTEAEVAAEAVRRLYGLRYGLTLRPTISGLIVVAALAVLLATLFLPMLQVSGSSMEPTLSDGDIILLVKTDSFETGDLLGFYYQNKLLLKRVIAGPGDIVDIDEEGNVYVNDELLDEPYVTEKSLGESDLSYPYQVPENRYFVLGDNRTTSIDSRSSAVGCIETEQIVGKVILRIWPLKRISIITI